MDDVILFRGRKLDVFESHWAKLDHETGRPKPKSRLVPVSELTLECWMGSESGAPVHIISLYPDVCPAVWICPFCGGIAIIDYPYKQSYPDTPFACDLPKDLIFLGYRPQKLGANAFVKQALAETQSDNVFTPKVITDIKGAPYLQDMIGTGKYLLIDTSMPVVEFKARFLDEFDGNDKGPTSWFAFEKGLAWTQVSNMTRAIKEFSRALELDPTNAIFRYERGNARVQIADVDGAIDDFTDVIQLSSDLAQDAYARRLNCYVALKDFERALSDCDRMLELEPDNKQALFWRIQILMSLSRIEDAMKIANHLLEIDPQNPQIWALRSDLRKASGDISGSKEDAKMARRWLGQADSDAQKQRWQFWK